MPHFSPINWLVTGFIFYFILMLFVSVLWWLHNYMFPKNFNIKVSHLNDNWTWV